MPWKTFVVHVLLRSPYTINCWCPALHFVTCLSLQQLRTANAFCLKKQPSLRFVCRCSSLKGNEIPSSRPRLDKEVNTCYSTYCMGALMIFNIRGLSGSGKTTTSKTIQSLYDERLTINLSYSGLDTGYILTDSTNTINPLVVLGEYSTHDRGCDSYDNPNQVIKLATHFNNLNYNVLYESHPLSADCTVPLALQASNIQVVAWVLDIEEDESNANRIKRSLARGNGGNIKSKTGIINRKQINRAYDKLVNNVYSIEKVSHPTPKERCDYVVQSYVTHITNQGRISPSTFVKTNDLMDLFSYTTSTSKTNKQLPETLFGTC